MPKAKKRATMTTAGELRRKLHAMLADDITWAEKRENLTDGRLRAEWERHLPPSLIRALFDQAVAIVDLRQMAGEMLDRLCGDSTADQASADYFEQMVDRLAEAHDAETAVEIWTALDPVRRFADSPIDLDIANKILQRRLKHIRQAATMPPSLGTTRDLDDIPF